jgi:hypothetical protein
MQDDQKAYVRLMITIKEVTSNVQSVSCPSPDICLQRQGNTRLTLSPSVVSISNYVTFFITLYILVYNFLIHETLHNSVLN